MLKLRSGELKTERLRAAVLRNFSLSVVQLSAFRSSSECAANFGDDAGEDGQKFVGFEMEVFQLLVLNQTILDQQLDPHLGLIGFLQEPIQFGAEFRV
jgi:hypothetical protein